MAVLGGTPLKETLPRKKALPIESSRSCARKRQRVDEGSDDEDDYADSTGEKEDAKYRTASCSDEKCSVYVAIQFLKARRKVRKMFRVRSTLHVTLS